MKNFLKNWPKISYIAFFYLVLIIPLLHIDQSDKSEQENRMLATWPELTVREGPNYKFGLDFDKWLSDRFFLRTPYTRIFTAISSLNTYQSTTKAFVGKNGWQFNQEEIDQHQPHTAEEVEKIRHGLKTLKKLCDQYSIKCYLEIAPRKEDFVGKQPFNLKNTDKGLLLSRQIDDILPVIMPYDELMAANKKDYIFFKTDHHWTEWGAYIGYQAIMKRIKEDFPDLKILTEDDYEIFYSHKVRMDYHRRFEKGYTCGLLNLQEHQCLANDIQYRYYQAKEQVKITAELFNGIDQKITRRDPPNNLRTILIGHSFTENFNTFWANSFAKTIKHRSNNPPHDDFKLSRWKEEIIAEKPDILVIMINSHHSWKLMNLAE